MDLLEHHGDALKRLPYSLLMVGGRDPLANSSRVAHRLLIARGFDSTLEVLPGAPHAFLTLPPAWNPLLSEEHSKPATQRILRVCTDVDAAAGE